MPLQLAGCCVAAGTAVVLLLCLQQWETVPLVEEWQVETQIIQSQGQIIHHNSHEPVVSTKPAHRASPEPWWHVTICNFIGKRGTKIT
jgi:hypothetical protein